MINNSSTVRVKCYRKGTKRSDEEKKTGAFGGRRKK